MSIGNHLFLGSIDGTTGQTVQYWVSNQSGLTPVGTRSIGSTSSNVSAIFTSDLTIGNKLDLSNKQIKNLAPPSNSLDGVNLAYSQANFAKIASSDNRLILKRYGSYTTEHDALSVIDISTNWLPSATGLMGLSAFLNFVPQNAGTQSLGAHGRTWAMVHANRAYTQQLITPSSLLRIGDMDPSLGTIREWWRIDAGTITPNGIRAIGSSAAPVNAITAATVVADRVATLGSLCSR